MNTSGSRQQQQQQQQQHSTPAQQQVTRAQAGQAGQPRYEKRSTPIQYYSSSGRSCVQAPSSAMSWWQRVRQAFVKPSSASSLKKNASENLSFLQKKYGDLAKDKGDDLRKTLKTSVSDYGKRAKDVPQHLKVRSAELGRQARARAEQATSSLGKQLGDSARALPSKTVEVATKAAQDAKAAGAEAAQNAASAGAKAAADAGRRATNKARDAMPKFGAYANDAGRRIAYLVLGTAFLYGLGSALPGAVARYYTEKDKDRRRDEERGGDGGSDSLSSSRVGEARGVLGEESVLLGMVEQWVRDR